MPQLVVNREGDMLVVDLGGRRRDLLLTPPEAEDLAEALAGMEADALAAPESVNTGRPWEVRIASFDGFVAVGFVAPGPGLPDSWPIPAKVIAVIVDLLRTNADMARNKLRIAVEKG